MEGNGPEAPFRELNADPAIMRFCPSILSAEQSDALASSIQTRMSHTKLWHLGLELPGRALFAGFVGLNISTFDDSLVEVA